DRELRADTARLQARLGRQNVLSVKFADAAVGREQALDFPALQREGRTDHLFLRVFQRVQKYLRAGLQQLGQVPDVRCPKFLAPGNQRRAIVDRGHFFEHGRCEGKEIAAEQLEIRGLVHVETI